MIMSGSFLPEPSWLVWHHQAYSGRGAGIVMESILLRVDPLFTTCWWQPVFCGPDYTYSAMKTLQLDVCFAREVVGAETNRSRRALSPTQFVPRFLGPRA